MADSPQARTMKLVRQRGWDVDVVERWIPASKDGTRRVRRDLFGCLDLVAIRLGRGGVWGIQCTTWGQHHRRVQKLRAEPRMRTWVLAGNRLSVISWRKGKTGRWEHRSQDLQASEIATTTKGAEQ